MAKNGKKQVRAYADEMCETLMSVVPDKHTCRKKGLKLKEVLAYSSGMAHGVIAGSRLPYGDLPEEPSMLAVCLLSTALDGYREHRDELIDAWKSGDTPKEVYEFGSSDEDPDADMFEVADKLGSVLIHTEVTKEKARELGVSKKVADALAVGISAGMALMMFMSEDDPMRYSKPENAIDMAVAGYLGRPDPEYRYEVDE